MNVAVYYDWQNVYKTARQAFGWTSMPNEYGNFSPYQLARLLAAGNGRGASAQLVRVEVHRGLPSQKARPRQLRGQPAPVRGVDEGGARARHSQARPLRYPFGYPTEPAVEKGVDVNLAVAALEHVLTDVCDVAILFSHDTDLMPVPETIARIRGADRVETASWQSPSFRRRPLLTPVQHLIWHRYRPNGVPRV